MISKGALRGLWLVSAGLATIVAAAPAAAQAEASREFDLPAQPLGETLRAIARLTNREIIFPAFVVEGRPAPPISGRFTFEEAVRAALANSDLVAEQRAGAILVRRRTAMSSAAADVTEGITVTGTRIRGARSPSPVIVSTRRSLEEAGVSDLAGYTRVLPQNFTGGQNPGVAGGGQQGGQSNVNNSATLNLRGLGADATLTLLNGHRLAYDALNQGVDISAIPLGAIDRIEVLPDGASALYGSDAVGGVANIILRRDFDGLETTARIGASTEGGNEQQQYGAVGGARWASGGFMAALDLSRTSPIFAEDRDYTGGLDPSLTLTLRSRQRSGVLAGHQRLGRVELEVDGVLLDRRSRKQTPFLPNAPAVRNGLVTRPGLRAHSLTPRLRADLPGGWQGSIIGTYAVSRTDIDSRRFLNGAETPSRLVYENRMKGAEVTAEGPLFAAQGGSARLAFGGGVRTVALDVNVRQTVAGRTTTTRDFTETRNVRFAYGELSLPLIGPDLGLALVDRLTLSGAVRYESYQGIDETATPKLGLVYQPHGDVTIRASWGKAFKVPTLNQVNQVLQGALLPGSLFSPQPKPPLRPGATVLLLGGGNPDLRSERATTWSATLELRPRLFPGLQLEGSYYHIDFHDRIGSPIAGTLSALPNPLYRDLIVFNPGAAEVNELVATLPQGLSNQTGRPFDPANVGAIVDTALRNTARVLARGVDLAASYRLETGPSERLLVTAAASYLKSDQRLSANQPLLEQSGTIFNPPHWRARAGATWQGPQIGASAFVSYVGSTRDNRFPDEEWVGPFVTLDLSASYRTGAAFGPLRDVEIRLSALNLLNEEPDPIRNSEPAAPPYDSTNQSPVGRFVGLQVRKLW